MYEYILGQWPFFINNSLSNDKILDWSKLKAFADDKINLNEKIQIRHGIGRKHLGKGENAGHQHFLLFLQCFQISLFQSRYMSGFCGKGLTHAHTMRPFDALKINSCRKLCEKRRNCL